MPYKLSPKLTVGILTIALLVVGCGLGTFSGVAGAATPAAPALRITSTASPTFLPAGAEEGSAFYMLRVTNVGAESTAGPIVITDTFPTGIVPDPAGQGVPPVIEAYDGRKIHFPCSEGPVMTCEYTEPLPPGGRLVVLIPLTIPASVSSPAINQVSAVGGGARPASATESSPVTTGQESPWGVQQLSNVLLDTDGGDFVEAGAHPYSYTADFQFTQRRSGTSNVPVRNSQAVSTVLPEGLVINPNATQERCTEEQFEAFPLPKCPDGSAVGVAEVILRPGSSAQPVPSAVYNMVPPPGTAAEFGLNPSGFPIYPHIIGSVDPAGDYVLTATGKDLPTYGELEGIEIELWGNPTDPSHDARRGECAYEGASQESCTASFQDSPLLTAPSACGQTTEFSVTGTPYQEPGDVTERSAPLTGLGGNPLSFTDCGSLEFAPRISSQPTNTSAESPTGLNFDLHQDQRNTVETRATAALKDVSVTLPPELTLNPSAANGLASCSEQQIGYQPQGNKIRFSADPQSCPDAAKVGTLQVTTPLLDHSLPGSVYVAKPYDNPFDSLLAVYLAVEDEKSGIIVKLAGKVTPDPQTGQLTATFRENPQLPLEDIELSFFDGPRATLKSPLVCSTYTTTSLLTPWSAPEGASATPSSSFTTSHPAPGSSVCPSSEAAAPNAPRFEAGTLATTAGTYSPFVLHLARSDGSQHLTGVQTTLPQGLLGRLAGIPYCPEADIAIAKDREAPNEGAVERAKPACPSASEVGSVTVGAGAGETPIYVSGKAYLAGPYKGAPLSLVIVTPAIAGPFDLGNVVTRVALNVGLYSAQIEAISDPLPTIIQGIPLDVRSIALRVDRPNFTLTPTSCNEMQITGAASTQAGQAATLSHRFQVGGCEQLKFKPGLKLSLKGATRRAGHPALKAIVTYPKKGAYANIARAQVNLPHSEFLDQANLNKVCKQAELTAGTCPKKAIYGKVKAWTPLLEKPLEGNVYLGVGFGYKLPALVAELNGQIRILLKGKVDTGKNHGIRNTFEAVPDAPISRFVLELKGGKKYGLFENSENICQKRQVAQTFFTAQNGKTLRMKPTISNDCGRKKSKHRGKKGKAAK